MKRLLMEDLKGWKERKDRMPLILQGARQVGKTWILQMFGKECFHDVCYINFENAGDIKDLFEGEIRPKRIIEFLSAIHGKRIVPHETLLIFDEIQEIPRALTSLKYFYEQAPEYAICCAGSLLGVTLHSGTSFPVGKVEFLTLQPLSFQEFLMANDEDAIIEWLMTRKIEAIPSMIASKLQDYLKFYFIVGGMPAVVNEWIQSKDFGLVEKKQRQILHSYENDFSKHAPSNIVPKLRYLWDSIPSQLAKENKKFVYGLVKEGARAREYEDALLWLQDSGIIRKLSRVVSGKLPLKAYVDLKSFKIYLLDIGLLRVMCEIDPELIVSRDALFSEFNGSFSEQFVMQELCGNSFVHIPYYWSGSATSEIDFMVSLKGKVLPIETKSGFSIHAQSLKAYRTKYHPELAIRTSLNNLHYQDGILDVPLYCLWNINEYIEELL